jgi:prefoldin subunit 5
MKDRIEARLAELRTEFEAGQRMLAELEEKRERLRESMLRIAGAIQVLEEMAGEGEGNETEESHVHTDVQS